MTRFNLWLLEHTPWLVAAGILTVLVSTVPAFHRSSYWLALSHQYFAAAALALALTPIMITGGIDLSVASVTVFASVVIGALWRDLGLPLEAAMIGGMLTGFLVGLANGSLVVIGVMPLVATLATRELFRGLAVTISGRNPVTDFPAELGDFWRATVLGLPLPFYIIAFLFVLTYVLVHHTWIGRMIYAIGDNEQAARFAGLPVRSIKLGLYAWCGLIAGLCGAVLVMRYGAAKADAEKYLDLTAIACVVLGGIRITGGAGSVVGTLLGTITVAALLAGLSSVAPEWRDTVTGVLLVLVAITNEAATRRAATKRLQLGEP